MGTPRKKPACAAHLRVGWRNLGAIYLGKSLIWASRLLKQGGTTLPGRAALRLSPQLIPFFSAQLGPGTTAITGTNGKTTTAALLASICKEAGRLCLHNAAGANLAWGIASTLIEASSWKGTLPERYAVLEIDEGAFPALSEKLHPRTALVTNIFRDQLDRFGGVMQVRSAIQRGVQALPPDALLLLNADDPLVASIDGGSRQTLYYGLDLQPRQEDAPESREEPPLSCPYCRRELRYSRLYYAHLGRYRCPSCGFYRPEPEFKLRRFSFTSAGGADLSLSLRGNPLQATLPLPGIYNLYNALSAAAAAWSCGLPEEAIVKALAAATPPAGRMERYRVDSRNLLAALIKNPAGANEVLRTLSGETAHDRRVHLLIAINDRIADGTDISWLEEIDFSPLNTMRARLGSITLSGTRACEVGQRLEEWDFSAGKMLLAPAPPQALRRAIARAEPGEKLIILANYTAMRELRRRLAR